MEEWVQLMPSLPHETQMQGSFLTCCPGTFSSASEGGAWCTKNNAIVKEGGWFQHVWLPPPAEHTEDVPEGIREQGGRPLCSAIPVTFEAPGRRRFRWTKQLLLVP